MDQLTDAERRARGNKKMFTGWSSATISSGEQRVGLVVTSLYLDRDGDTRVEVATSTVVPVGKDAIRVADRYDVEFSRRDGVLFNKTSVELQDEKLTRKLAFDPEERAWHVHGLFRGERFETRLPRDSELFSHLGRTWALRRAIAESGVGAEFWLLDWISARPGELVESHTTLLEERDEGHFIARVVLGGEERLSVFDAQGSALRSSVELDAATLRFERVFSEGSF